MILKQNGNTNLDCILSTALIPILGVQQIMQPGKLAVYIENVVTLSLASFFN
jgi:hypothetical protein